MGTIRNMLYDATDINWEARERAEMLSVRPAPAEHIHSPGKDKAALRGAIFCFVMVALLVVTWWML